MRVIPLDRAREEAFSCFRAGGEPTTLGDQRAKRFQGRTTKAGRELISEVILVRHEQRCYEFSWGGDADRRPHYEALVKAVQETATFD